MKKTVLVSCGTAIATSTVVANALKEAMKERGIELETRQCKTSEIKAKLAGIDLVVSTTPVPSDLEVPAIQTLAFLTGIGKEAVLDQVEEILKSK